MDPTPRGEVEDQQPLPGRHVELVVEQRDQTFDDVEGSEKDKHRAGEVDPADPPRPLSRAARVPRAGRGSVHRLIAHDRLPSSSFFYCRDIAIRISDSLSVIRSPLTSTVTSCRTPVKR